MSFIEQYTKLETEFKEQVDRDNEDLGIESHFLANIAPKAPVDYILVAMEPSLGGGSGEQSSDTHAGKNFSGSLEDFILHYCVYEYLCGRERTYYLTDLSKGAMSVETASESDDRRYERYKRWYPFLLEEIELVGPDAPIIPVGNVVRDFLTFQKMPHLEDVILHYSKSASRYRPRMKQRFPDRYAKFKDTVGFAVIEDTVKRVMGEAELGSAVHEATLERLQRGSRLTDSRKQLMFTYKCEFEAIL